MDTSDIPDLLRELVPATFQRRAVTSTEGDAESLRRRLATLTDEEQRKWIQDLVLTYAAGLLGHSDPKAVDPDRGFLESGFDSLTATQLRARLNAATGLRLPPMVVFDSKNVAELARRVRDELAESAEHSREVALTQTAAPADTLTELWRAGVLAGDVPKTFTMLRAVADLRPAFDSPADLERLPEAEKLAEGAGGPRLICICTPMVAGGAHQHARLAAHFRGTRNVSALPLPGFARDERLPATADAAIEVLAESVLREAAGEPFVLVGYSSGGVLSYAIAHFLETTKGVSPAGVVLLDSYAVKDGSMPEGFEHMTYRMLDMESTFGPYSSAELSAMSRYFHFLPDFSRESIRTPVLFVGVEDSFIPVTAGTENSEDFPRALPWYPEHTFRVAPGNHFTLVEERAESAAHIIEDWLREIS